MCAAGMLVLLVVGAAVRELGEFRLEYRRFHASGARRRDREGASGQLVDNDRVHSASASVIAIRYSSSMRNSRGTSAPTSAATAR